MGLRRYMSLKSVAETIAVFVVAIGGVGAILACW